MRRTFWTIVALMAVYAIFESTRHETEMRRLAALPDAPVTPVAQNPVSSTAQLAKAKKCKKLLANARRLGLWNDYSGSASGLTVYVGDAWWGASYEVKGILNESLRCVLTDGRMDAESLPVIVYADPRTHNDVATWTPSMSLQIK